MFQKGFWDTVPIAHLHLPAYVISYPAYCASILLRVCTNLVLWTFMKTKYYVNGN